jgi:F-type H+-transporting ATPase subunit b
MNKILYAPILGIMDERKRFIDSNYENAKENDSKSEALEAEREEKLDCAKDDARKNYIEVIDGYKSDRAEKLVSAQKDANEKIVNSNEELQRVSDEVKDSLKNSMTNLASDIVEKVIGYRSEVQGFDNDAVSSVLWGEGK